MDLFVEDKDALFAEVFAHLSQVEAQPGSTVLNADLLKRAERSLDASTPKELLWRLLRTGEKLLQILQQDPRPLTRMLERDVLLIPFDELKASISAEKLEEGLQSHSLPVQLLCLTYLRKAADMPSGAAFVAASSSLVCYLVTLWLSTESTEVSERALEVLEALLVVDSPVTVTVITTDAGVGQAQGQGLFWRRMFHDPEVYLLLFEWTSLVRSQHDLDSKNGRQAATISQARLFDFIARLAQLNWAAVTTSTLPDVEAPFIKEAGQHQLYGGLLRYAASSMIDQNDYLMEVLRQEFFLKLLNVVEEDGGRNVSPRLLAAIQHEAGIEGNGQTDSGMHL